jgi:hypothetical protein
MKRVIFLLTLFAVGCSNLDNEEELEPFTGSIPESMKGYELYSWKENKVWNFTLITGTNRLKAHQEITACGNKTEHGFVKVTVRDIPQLKDLLTRVPAEQYVTWISNAAIMPGFSMPPANVVSDIQDHCAAHNLHMQVNN